VTITSLVNNPIDNPQKNSNVLITKPFPTIFPNHSIFFAYSENCNILIVFSFHHTMQKHLTLRIHLQCNMKGGDHSFAFLCRAFFWKQFMLSNNLIFLPCFVLGKVAIEQMLLWICSEFAQDEEPWLCIWKIGVVISKKWSGGEGISHLSKLQSEVVDTLYNCSLLAMFHTHMFSTTLMNVLRYADLIQ
jgi:hypothetical protein